MEQTELRNMSVQSAGSEGKVELNRIGPIQDA